MACKINHNRVIFFGSLDLFKVLKLNASMDFRVACSSERKNPRSRGHAGEVLDYSICDGTRILVLVNNMGKKTWDGHE